LRFSVAPMPTPKLRGTARIPVEITVNDVPSLELDGAGLAFTSRSRQALTASFGGACLALPEVSVLTVTALPFRIRKSSLEFGVKLVPGTKFGFQLVGVSQSPSPPIHVPAEANEPDRQPIPSDAAMSAT